MYIVNYFDYENKSLLIAEIRKCDWGAAKFLADILEQNRFEELLGGGELFVLMDGDKIVSYCTLTKNDCVKDGTLYPWIGFLFTVPEYRGHRYSEQVIDKAYVTAIEQGHKGVYLATDHVGFYENYGFTYLETRVDIYDEESRIYYR